MKMLGSQETVKIPASSDEIFVQDAIVFSFCSYLHLAVQCWAQGVHAHVDFYMHSILLTQFSRKWDMEHVKAMQMSDVCGGRLVESSHLKNNSM